MVTDDTLFNPLFIPDMQDSINMIPITTAMASHRMFDWAIPKTASMPAPICIRPTPMEFATALHRQKIVRPWINVVIQGIFPK